MNIYTLILAASMTSLEGLGMFGLFLGCFLAATVLPFSSDALYVAALLATGKPVECLIIGTLGNWLGSITTYWLGRLAKWEWLEKVFKIKRETLEKQKKRVDKYGMYLGVLSWIPIIGDIFALALGFYKSPAIGTMLFLLLGKFGRFAVWTLILL